jgi:hypothetical protein
LKANDELLVNNKVLEAKIRVLKGEPSHELQKIKTKNEECKQSLLTPEMLNEMIDEFLMNS